MFPGDDSALILDGGLATELAARGHDISDSLWSARLLIDDPGAVVEAHSAFFRAGARVATTATYQASFPGFRARGFSSDETAEFLRLGVRIAKEARDGVADSTTPRWVAGSIGPYGAMLADGSEYRGRYGLSVRELIEFHRPRMEIVAAAGSDVLALETVPDADEGEALVTVLDEFGVKAWLSYTVENGRTRAGQHLEEAFSVASGHANVIAVGVNCCAPDEVKEALLVAREVTGKPGVAYPNSGEGWDAQRREWTGTPTYPLEWVADWYDAGARLIGGCCRVSPLMIAELSKRLGRPDRQSYGDDTEHADGGESE